MVCGPFAMAVSLVAARPTCHFCTFALKPLDAASIIFEHVRVERIVDFLLTYGPFVPEYTLSCMAESSDKCSFT